MGVPRLFSWIKRNFNKSVTYFEQGSKTQLTDKFYVDYLYLDANPLIYNAKMAIEYKDPLSPDYSPYSCLSKNQLFQLIMELFCEELVQLTQMVKPTKVLYIALDGVAPQAKQVQQRSRRYLAPSDSSSLNISTTNFSPGTQFMNDLSEYLNLYLRREMSRNQHWRDIKIILSDSNSPGEGEHKILQYIRNMPDKIKQDNKISHCIYGPDGDLVMLTLSSYLENIYLFKPDQYSTGFYYLVNMGSVRTQLPNKMHIERRYHMVEDTNKYFNDVINDFVLLGFLVGNDFLPRLQMFIYLEDGLNMMIEHYSNITHYGSEKSNLITINGKIHLRGFTNLIKSLALEEPGYLVNQMDKIESRELTEADEELQNKLRNNTLMKYITTNGKTKSLDMTGYRKAYYAKSNIDVDTPAGDDQVISMCHDYFMTIRFVFDYYTKELPSWTHNYKWYYPPLMVDFSKYLNSLTIADFDKQKFTLGTPPSPYIQLLSILPPHAFNLLPKEYRNVYKHPKLTHLYPLSIKDIEIDYEGKLKEHEGVVKLPFIDRELVESVLDKDITYSDVPSQTRAKVELERPLAATQPTILVFEPRINVTYKNKYGELRDIHIRSSKTKK